MEQFLQQHSSLPKEFIKDFYSIAKEEYRAHQLIINFDVVCKWLQVTSGNLKRTLINNFEDKYDYTIERLTKNKKSGGTFFYKIMITPNCFKELCMISQTTKAKEVRKYFIEMERLVKQYYEMIQKEVYTELGLVKKNQKPKVCPKSGILYIIKANNTSDTLYKIGRTKNLCNRMKTYNSGEANDLEPLFIVPVKDIDGSEKCVKSLIKQFQYRKYKEIYEVDIDVLKELMMICTEVSDVLQKYYENNKKTTLKNIKDMKKKQHKYFVIFDKDE